MDSGLTKTIGLAIVTAVLATFVTLANGGAAENTAAGTVATAADTAHRDSTVTIRWLTDANVISLVAAMNAKQVALADAELQAWHSDTVRAYATEIARNHAALQHSADSVAAQLHLAPLAPAVQDEIVAALQAHVDTVAMSRGPQMDRVFVQQSAAAHALVADYLAQMSAAAQAPEMQAFLENAQGRVSAEVTRAKQVQTMFAVADSVAADSVAKRAAARRSRQGQR